MVTISTKKYLVALILLLASFAGYAQSPVIGAGGGNGSATSIQNVPVSAPTTIFGQDLMYNGSALAPSLATTAFQAPGIVNIGDSITCGYALGNYTADGTPDGAYSWIMGSEVGGTQINTCHSGDAVSDQMFNKVVPLIVPAPTYQPITTVLLGTNDYNTFGSGAGAIANYTAEYEAMGAYLAVPQSFKVMASTCTQTSGTWTSNTVGNITGEQSTVNGSVLTCTVTSTGKPILVSYRAFDSNANGTANVTIDSVAKGSLTSAGFSGQTITTGHGTTQAEFLAIYSGITAGTHTIQFTVTNSASNAFVVDWLGSAGAGESIYFNLSQVSPPRVGLGGVPPQQGGANASLVAAYYNAGQAAANADNAAGLNVFWVPTQTFINTGNDFVQSPTIVYCDDGTSGVGTNADPLHPNYCGQKHLAAAFNSVLTPAATPQAINELLPTTVANYFNVNGQSNAIAGTALSGGLNIYSANGSNFGMDLFYNAGYGFGTRLYAPANGNGNIAMCFHQIIGGTTNPSTQAQMSYNCPFLLIYNQSLSISTPLLTSSTLQANNFQQVAANNTGGKCTMSAATSCTITLGHTYTVPVCVATVQSATVIAGGCTVSGNVATITAASSNSATWGAWVFGDPN